MQVNYKATIQKGKPMPMICEICGSCKAIRKSERNLEKPENNSCFETASWGHDYQPFTNSKRKVKVTCEHFSHLRTFKAW